MNKNASTNSLPLMTLLLGGAAGLARKFLYAQGVDERGLLVPNHPCTIAVGLLTLAALIYLLLSVRRLDGSDKFEDNFRAGKPAMLGHFAAAAGILLTVLTRDPMMYGYLGDAWMLFGWLSPVCLTLAGISRLKGKKPFFLLHLAPCLFLMLHIINHYQTWSGNPQLQNYVFTLFGTMALMLFAFYNAAFDADTGNRRMQLFTGLAAVYLLMAELPTAQYTWLYLGGILWALTDLCCLTPVPRSEPEPKEEG